MGLCPPLLAIQLTLAAFSGLLGVRTAASAMGAMMLAVVRGTQRLFFQFDAEKIQPGSEAISEVIAQIHFMSRSLRRRGGLYLFVAAWKSGKCLP
jgi:hypothetical protein